MIQRLNYDIAGWTLALGITALFAIANLFDQPQLWGINFYTFLPPVWTYLVLSIIVVALLPQITSRLLALSERLSSLMADNDRARWAVLSGAARIFGVLCWICS